MASTIPTTFREWHRPRGWTGKLRALAIPLIVGGLFVLAVAHAVSLYADHDHGQSGELNALAPRDIVVMPYGEGDDARVYRLRRAYGDRTPGGADSREH